MAEFFPSIVLRLPLLLNTDQKYSGDFISPLPSILFLFLYLWVLISQAMRFGRNLLYATQAVLLGLINSILDFSKIEAGKMQLNYEPTDISTLLRKSKKQQYL